MDDVTIRPATGRATKMAPVSSFTGTVLQDSLAAPQAPSRTSATLVTFTPGARTNWHTHKTRQVLDKAFSVVDALRAGSDQR